VNSRDAALAAMTILETARRWAGRSNVSELSVLCYRPKPMVGRPVGFRGKAFRGPC
jgi:hypothetical protein